MRAIVVAAILVVIVIAAFAFGLIDIDQTRETKLPEVAVEGGQAPAFDVDAADVDVGTQNTAIKVPDVDVDVDTTKENVKLPTVNVDKAE